MPEPDQERRADPTGVTQRNDPKEAALRILEKVGANDGPCFHGCGEMGSCHPNLNLDALLLAEVFLGRRKAERLPVAGKKMKCPGCPLRLPADDLQAQMAHMDANHPEIIAKRRAEMESLLGWASDD